jgi:pyruvate/2-oxoglutarate dehydrogenase complex dihydrolipoamide dehydrogenase (E3) component
MMFVPHAIHDGYAAATNAVLGPTYSLGDQTSPVGSFTDPEYAHVGLSEAEARERHEVVVAHARYADSVRPIIDGHTVGFCKVIVDSTTRTILGCHIVGERAVELSQIAAVALAAKLPIQELARIPWAFPTYSGVFGRAVVLAARDLDESGVWSADDLTGPLASLR